MCCVPLVTQVYKVETAGDCYIVAGGLMTVDDEGFMHIDQHPNAQQGAEKVMAFAKVYNYFQLVGG
jgi:hypothetical protein